MDAYYMKRALELAKKGRGRVNPNPLVGAVIVKQGKIIGEGYHEAYGKAHAEVNALANASEDVTGATMYVTLEPCAHYGKTPPCAERIIKEKIAKVVIAMVDPNPKVAGQGIGKLRAANIELVVGVLEQEAKKLNEVFIKYITQKRPFVILKSAMSLDGKIITSTGESKWITGETSRQQVHQLRNELTSIMVGVNTIIEDNPRLTCRLNKARNPIRIVVDTTLRIPINAYVIEHSGEAQTIIASTERADMDKVLKLRNKGIKVLITPLKNSQVDLQDLMFQLGALNIDSILLEGGSTLNFSALQEGIVDKVQFYIAPKLIGGEKAKTPVGGVGINQLKDAFLLKDMCLTKVGEDILIEGYLKGDNKNVYRNH